MLQCALEYHEISAAKKEELRQASLVDEPIIKAYNKYIVAKEGVRTHAVVRGTGENIEDQRTKRSRPFGPVSSGDTVFYRDDPPPPNYQVLPVAQ